MRASASSCDGPAAASQRPCWRPSSLSRRRTYCSRWTRSRPSSRSPPTPFWSLRPTPSPSWATERRGRGADLVDHGGGDSSEGNSQEGPQETGHGSPGREGEDDRQGVESQDPPHDERLENMGIGLVDGSNQGGD